MDTIWLYDSGMEFIKGLALDLGSKNSTQSQKPKIKLSKNSTRHPVDDYDNKKCLKD